MVDVALLVAEDLNLDVAGADDHLFEVALAVAKGRLRLAPAFQNLFLQFLRTVDRAHPASAAAPGRLQHQGIADLLGLLGDGLEIVAQNLCRRDDRHARLDGDPPGRGLVAKRAHRLGPRPDEGDARRVAGVDEIRVLGQEAIARVDRVRAAFLRNAYDFIDREIGLHRAKPFSDSVGLVRLEAVKAQLVLFCEDRDGLLTHLVRSPHDADRDFTAVGDENLLEIGHVCWSSRA